MARSHPLPWVLLGALLAVAPIRGAAEILDGQKFSGMIGPAENPDLPDTLSFQDGHFWSDICTDCGFYPGTYSATKQQGGIRFEGQLESESRGQFDYEGVVWDDGTITVTIEWQRKRWYWTARRTIAFEGARDPDAEVDDLSSVMLRLGQIKPENNPQCARF